MKHGDIPTAFAQKEKKKNYAMVYPVSHSNLTNSSDLEISQHCHG